VEQGLAIRPQSAVDREDAAEAGLQAGGHRRDDLLLVRRRRDDSRADHQRRWRADAMTVLAPIEGPAAWQGAQIDYREEGMHVLSGGEIDEIDAALDHLRAFGDIDFPEITRDKFPLPRFGEFLAGVADDLHSGRGFLLLRGLPRERYLLDDLARIYVGLGTHIGRLIPQSYQGELLGHVIDVSDVEAEARGYHKGGSQRMHADNCDIVSLMCVQAA